jgi:tetratricopeptide (TPR) repeat protein
MPDSLREDPSAARGRLITIALPFAVFLCLSALLGGWIIDDAGISYAYARSLARGYGLVQQPGFPPVEGFSNFLWLVLLAPTFWLHLFDPVVTPKCISAGLVLASFILLERTLSAGAGPFPRAFAVTLALALSPPIVIWTMSGLENALTLLLAVALVHQLALRPRHWASLAGILTALLAMAHPEAILFVLTGLLCSAIDQQSLRHRARAVLAYASGFAALFGPFLALRLLVFGRPLPHTYYAKREYLTPWARLAALAGDPSTTYRRWNDLVHGVVGPIAIPLVIVVMAGVAYLIARGRANRVLVVSAVLTLNATAAFLWMEDDWMHELRFATALILAAWTTTVLVIDGLVRALLAERLRPVSFAVVLATIAVSLSADSLPRIWRFARRPPTPYGDVSRRMASQFDAYARAAGMKNPSILTADVGATLFESNLRVYDLAGLCNPDVVHTLKGDSQYWLFQHPAFYDYVFERIRPTFISTDKFWTHVAAFELDPRFRRDYVALNAHEDNYVRRLYGVTAHSGDFVRRDALRDVGDVQRMRESYAPAPRADPLVYRIEDFWDRDAGGLDERTYDPGVLLALAASDPDRAATVLEPLLTGTSRADLNLLVLLGESLDSAGRPHEGRRAWSRARTLGQEQGNGAMSLRALHRLADPRPAVGTKDALDADMAQALFLVAVRRDPAGAVLLFDQILAANPAHYGATFQRAQALEGMGRRDDALAAWRDVAELAADVRDDKMTGTARDAISRLTAPKTGAVAMPGP